MPLIDGYAVSKANEALLTPKLSPSPLWAKAAASARRSRMEAELSTTCSWGGCETRTRPNPPDLENGPSESDLDPVLCAYHDDEMFLVSHFAEDVARDLVADGTWTIEEAFERLYGAD